MAQSNKIFPFFFPTPIHGNPYNISFNTTFNHLVSLLSVKGSLQLIKYLYIEWLASRITPSQVFFSEFFFPLTNFNCANI